MVSDEKEKYDPNAFRDNVLQGFTAADSNLEQVGDQINAFYSRHKLVMVDVHIITSIE